MTFSDSIKLALLLYMVSQISDTKITYHIELFDLVIPKLRFTVGF